ncbi:MAG: shikimate kinase [Bryobacteraceae bacterium]|jgi:shikimate kinase
MIHKLKLTPGIYLVGFMASGKTTIGRQLAYELGWSFADTDEDLEAEQKQTIAQIFETRGEDEFRKVEARAIQKRVKTVRTGRPLVVSLGGGAFSQQDNFELLESNGVTIWLDCPLALVRARLTAQGGMDRPLARDAEKLEHLFFARRAAYQRADYRIEVTGDNADQTVKKILALPIF